MSSYKQFFLLTLSFDNTAPDTEYNLLLFPLNICAQKSLAHSFFLSFKKLKSHESTSSQSDLCKIHNRITGA